MAGRRSRQQQLAHKTVYASQKPSSEEVYREEVVMADT